MGIDVGGGVGIVGGSVGVRDRISREGVGGSSFEVSRSLVL